MALDKILLAIDGITPTENAIRWTLDLAERDRARVVLVYPFAPIPNYLGESWQQELVKRNLAEAEATAERTASVLRAGGLDVEVVVGAGLPVDVILRTATDHGCGLIIITNRAHGEVATLLSGSTSQRVIAHARVPVLVVRA